MADEGSFLRAILANPADDLPRLVYADWLDEQQTEEASRKAEFLRVVVALTTEFKTGPRLTLEQRQMDLARDLLPGWLSVVGRMGVENCAVGGTAVNDWRLRRSLETVEFAYECPKDWAGMLPTDDDAVRYCGACQKNVYFCDTVDEARNHAWAGDCVAVHLGRPRSTDDLEMPLMSGIVAPDYWDRAEDEKGEGTG
jgi:uncharacterized protein (TIGR02996 family)